MWSSPLFEIRLLNIRLAIFTSRYGGLFQWTSFVIQLKLWNSVSWIKALSFDTWRRLRRRSLFELLSLTSIVWIQILTIIRCFLSTQCSKWLTRIQVYLNECWLYHWLLLYFHQYVSLRGCSFFTNIHLVSTIQTCGRSIHKRLF